MEKVYNVDTVNVSETATPEVIEFCEAIRACYLELFPAAWIVVEVRKVLGTKMIRIRCGVQSEGDLSGGYRDNDPGDQIITIDLPDSLEGFNSMILVTEGMRNSMTLKPTDKFHVYSSERFGYRKAKGTPDKLVKHFERYFAKCKDKIEAWRKDDKLAHKIP